jgi:hypothetical protein
LIGKLSSFRDDVSRMPADAAFLYAYIKRPYSPGELKWQQIPWMVNLGEGRRLAEEEKRPLLIWASADDPLGKC